MKKIENYTKNIRRERILEKVGGILKDNGWLPYTEGSIVYESDKKPYNLVLLNLPALEMRKVCDKDSINGLKKEEFCMYLMAHIPGLELIKNMYYVNNVWRENNPGLRSDIVKRDRVKIVYSESEDNASITMPILKDISGLLLGLGLVTSDGILHSVKSLENFDDVDALINSTELNKSMQTIKTAKDAYAEIVNMMPEIANKRQAEYYDGKDDALGPAIAELGIGRHIVIKPVMLNCYRNDNTGNVHPLINGSVSIASRIMSPEYTIIKRPLDEKPINLTKCDRETFEEQISTQVALFTEYLKKAEIEELKLYEQPMIGMNETKGPSIMDEDALISYA